MHAIERIRQRAWGGIPSDVFAGIFQDWSIDEFNGAYVLHKGPEYHVESFNDGKWCSRKVLRQTLGAAIKQYGYAETSVRRTHDAGHKLAKRLGFVVASENEFWTVYRLYKSPHLKE